MPPASPASRCDWLPRGGAGESAPPFILRRVRGELFATARIRTRQAPASWNESEAGQFASGKEGKDNRPLSRPSLIVPLALSGKLRKKAAERSAANRRVGPASHTRQSWGGVRGLPWPLCSIQPCREDASEDTRAPLLISRELDSPAAGVWFACPPP